MDRLRLKKRNWRSRLEEQTKWFFFFYLLALKLENILFGTHLAKWGIFSNRITNLMSRPLKSGVWFHLELPVHTCPQCGKQTGIRNLCMAAQLSISGSRGIRYCDGKTQALYLKPGFSQGTGRQDLSGEYPEGQRAQENWLIFKDNLFRAEWSILTGRKPRVSGKGDEELLSGLQHNRIIREQTRGQATQKKHRNISRACRARTRHAKYPLRSKLVRNVEGSKADSYRAIGTRGGLRKMRLLCPSDKGYRNTWNSQYPLCLSLHCQGFLLGLPALTGSQQSSYRK